MVIASVAAAADLKSDLVVGGGVQQDRSLGSSLVGGSTGSFTNYLYVQGVGGASYPVTFAAEGTPPSFVTGVTGGSIPAVGEAYAQESTISYTVPCALGGFSGQLNYTAQENAATTDIGVASAYVNITGTVTSVGSNCDTDDPLVVGSITGDSTGPEGAQKTYSVSASDDDPITHTWSITAGSAYAAIDGATNGSSVSVDFVDGLVPSTGSVFTLQVVVSGTVTKTLNITVTNETPVVATPSWATSSVDCRQSATLQRISFDDAGNSDNPWSLAIAWGDSSADYTDTSVAAEGGYLDQTHTYNTPGTYSATVAVTDKDGGQGTNSSGNLTVNQAWSLTFLQPIDGSTPSNRVANTVKRGRVVPVKVTIFDICQHAYVNDPTTAVKILVKDATFTSSVSDAVETFTDAGQSSGQTQFFRWNADSSVAGGGFWIYNLDTSGFSLNTAQEVRVQVGTNAQIESRFAIIKATK
jgi:hypothetical protein